MQRPDDELVGVNTAAQFLGCSPTKVYQLGFNRIIPSVGGTAAAGSQWATCDVISSRLKSKMPVGMTTRRRQPWRDRLKERGGIPSARNDSFQGQERTERWPDQERTSILNWFASLLAWG